MNYSKIYDDLIVSRLQLKEKRNLEKKSGSYFENHHIIPKCKGGSNSKNNLVLLTAREHFLSHWLLWLIYRDRQTALAFHKMNSNNSKQKRVLSSRDYEKTREAFRVTNLGNTYGKVHKGRVISQEQKEKISLSMKGRFKGDKNPFFGKKHSDETKLILSSRRSDKKTTEIYNYRGKKLIYKEGIFIKAFDTVNEVAYFINCSPSNVRHVLSGNQKLANGYYIKHEN
jgi:hypothetical protein